MRDLVRQSVEILCSAVEEFSGNVFVTSSFQTQSVAFLHLVSQHASHLPVWFIDTGFHFPETIEFRDEITRELGLDLRIHRPSALTREEAQGQRLAGRSEVCCQLLKVSAIASLLRDHEGGCWISGVRSDQTRARAYLRVRDEAPQGVTRVHPMLYWREWDVTLYRKSETDLGVHPLRDIGYSSIGCAPCTSRGFGRKGRWPGSSREGCGIHGLVKHKTCEE